MANKSRGSFWIERLLQLPFFPNTRNDGATNRVLYTAANGDVQHGPLYEISDSDGDTRVRVQSGSAIDNDAIELIVNNNTVVTYTDNNLTVSTGSVVTLPTNGNDANPILEFGLDSGTGIYSNGTGSLAVTVQGDERIRFGTGPAQLFGPTGGTTGALMRFRENAANGTDYVQVGSPSLLSSSYNFYFPEDAPSAGDVMVKGTGTEFTWEQAALEDSDVVFLGLTVSDAVTFDAYDVTRDDGSTKNALYVDALGNLQHGLVCTPCIEDGDGDTKIRVAGGDNNTDTDVIEMLASNVVGVQVFSSQINLTQTLGLGSYPSSRDDGTAVNFLHTNASGILQSSPVSVLSGSLTDLTDVNEVETFEDTFSYVPTYNGGLEFDLRSIPQFKGIVIEAGTAQILMQTAAGVNAGQLRTNGTDLLLQHLTGATQGASISVTADDVVIDSPLQVSDGTFATPGLQFGPLNDNGVFSPSDIRLDFKVGSVNAFQMERGANTRLTVSGGDSNGGRLRLLESDAGGGSLGTTLQARSDLASDLTITLPSTQGNEGDVLTRTSGSTGTEWETPSVFGQFHVDATSTAASTTTSNAYQTKVTITTSDLPAGRYRVAASFAWGYNNATRNFHARLLEDSVTVLKTMEAESKDAGADIENPGNMLAYTDLTAGVHTFQLQYATQTNGDTARIEQATLEFWRVS